MEKCVLFPGLHGCAAKERDRESPGIPRRKVEAINDLYHRRKIEYRQ